MKTSYKFMLAAAVAAGVIGGTGPAQAVTPQPETPFFWNWSLPQTSGDSPIFTTPTIQAYRIQSKVACGPTQEPNEKYTLSITAPNNGVVGGPWELRCGHLEERNAILPGNYALKVKFTTTKPIHSGHVTISNYFD